MNHDNRRINRCSSCRTLAGGTSQKQENKERADIPRVKMNELDPEYRSRTRLEEVNLGLTKEQAMQEAERCLDCPNPTCMQGCPVNINIPTFIKNIERGEFLEAAKTLKETSALPAVCGRVCPQEKQCESKCIHLKMSRKRLPLATWSVSPLITNVRAVISRFRRSRRRTVSRLPW